ncbi:MAG: hypothetical protein WC151_12475 [Bacteroidales bacterium]
MNMDRIPLLIDKYFEGNTTIEEEKEIREFFNTLPGLPDNLLPYKDFFMAIDAAARMEPSSELEMRIRQRIEMERKRNPISRRIYITAGIAAALMLVIGFQQIIKQQPVKTIDDPVIAMQIVTDAFSQVNKTMEKGMSSMYYIAEAKKANEAIKRINVLNESVEKTAKIHFISHSYKAFQNTHTRNNTNK